MPKNFSELTDPCTDCGLIHPAKDDATDDCNRYQNVEAKAVSSDLRRQIDADVRSVFATGLALHGFV